MNEIVGKASDSVLKAIKNNDNLIVCICNTKLSEPLGCLKKKSCFRIENSVDFWSRREEPEHAGQQRIEEKGGKIETEFC